MLKNPSKVGSLEGEADEEGEEENEEEEEQSLSKSKTPSNSLTQAEEEDEEEQEGSEETKEHSPAKETATKKSVFIAQSKSMTKSLKSTKSLLTSATTILPSKMPIQATSSVAFFQHKEDFQRRVSDDTIYLGKTGTDRNFEEKVELMKKVWEVYTGMKHEGMTLEAAKMYMAPNEMDALAEADMLTKGSLLKFLTALLPDDKMYPFNQPAKAKVPVYHGIPNALAIKLFNIEKKFSSR